jgi:hypothetical protein
MSVDSCGAMLRSLPAGIGLDFERESRRVYVRLCLLTASFGQERMRAYLLCIQNTDDYL